MNIFLCIYIYRSICLYGQIEQLTEKKNCFNSTNSNSALKKKFNVHYTEESRGCLNDRGLINGADAESFL